LGKDLYWVATQLVTQLQHLPAIFACLVNGACLFQRAGQLGQGAGAAHGDGHRVIDFKVRVL